VFLPDPSEDCLWWCCRQPSWRRWTEWGVHLQKTLWCSSP